MLPPRGGRAPPPPSILVVSHGGFIKEFVNAMKRRKAGPGGHPPAPYANAAQNTAARCASTLSAISLRWRWEEKRDTSRAFAGVESDRES